MQLLSSSKTSLYYYGGSGGHFCLHLLLLAGKYNCFFISGDNFSDVFKNQWYSKQWNNNNIKFWKTTEARVDNQKTIQSAIENKLFLFPNPTKYQFAISGTKIIIYTDIVTQFYMAWNKRACWFNDMVPIEENNKIYSSSYRKTLDEIYRLAYIDIRESSWPDSTSIDHFKKLPVHVQKKILDHWQIDNVDDENIFLLKKLHEKFIESQAILWNGDLIDKRLLEEIDIESADVVVKQQDIIKTNGKALFDQLGLIGNSATDKLIKDYVDLHPPELKELLLK